VGALKKQMEKPPKIESDNYREDLERRAQAAEEEAKRTGTGAYSREAIRQRTIDEFKRGEQSPTFSKDEVLQSKKEAVQKKFRGLMDIEIVNDVKVLQNLERNWNREGFIRRQRNVELEASDDIEKKLGDVLSEPQEYRIAFYNGYAIIFEWNPKFGGEEETHQ
jgi:hypothetical protein